MSASVASESPAGPPPVEDYDDAEELEAMDRANALFSKALLDSVDRQLAEKETRLLDAQQATEEEAGRREAVGVALHRSKELLRLAEKERDEAVRKLEISQRQESEMRAREKAMLRREEESRSEAEAERRLAARARDEAEDLKRQLKAAGLLASTYADTVDVHKRMESKTESDLSAVQEALKASQEATARTNRRLDAVAAERQKLAEKLAAQEEETRTAQRMLEKMGEELNLAQAGKRVVLAQWQDALDAMSRRDTVLQMVEDDRKKASAALESAEHQARSLTDGNEDLVGQLKSAQQEALSMRTKLDSMQATLADLDGENRGLKNELDATAQAVQISERDVGKLERELETLRKERDAKVSKLQDTSATAAAQVADADSQVRTARAAEENAVRQTERMLKEARTTLETQQAQLRRLQTETTTKSIHNLALERNVRVLHAEYSVLYRAHQKLSDRFEAVWTDTNTMVDNLRHKEYEVNMLKAKLSTAEGKHDADGLRALREMAAHFKAESAAKDAKVLEMRQNWTRVQMDLVAANGTIERLEREAVKLRTTDRVSASQAARSEARVDTFSKDMRELQVQNDAMRLDRQRLSQENVDLHERVGKLEDEVNALRVKMRGMEKDHQMEVGSHKSKLQQMGAELQKMRLQHVEDERHKANLEAKLQVAGERHASRKDQQHETEAEFVRLRQQFAQLQRDYQNAMKSSAAMAKQINVLYPKHLDARRDKRLRERFGSALPYHVSNTERFGAPESPRVLPEIDSPRARSEGGAKSAASSRAARSAAAAAAAERRAATVASSVRDDAGEMGTPSDASDASAAQRQTSVSQAAGKVGFYGDDEAYELDDGTYTPPARAITSQSMGTPRTKSVVSNLASSERAISVASSGGDKGDRHDVARMAEVRHENERLKSRYRDLSDKLLELDGAFAESSQTNHRLKREVEKLKRDSRIYLDRYSRAEALAASIEKQLKTLMPTATVKYDYRPEMRPSAQLADALRGGKTTGVSVSSGVATSALLTDPTAAARNAESIRSLLGPTSESSETRVSTKSNLDIRPRQPDAAAGAATSSGAADSPRRGKGVERERR